MIGGGPFGLEPGQWSDDSSMALCLAESLVEKQGFDAKDQIDRDCRWWREGYLNSTGMCFDIGDMVRKSLESYLHSGEPLAGSEDPLTAGNGSLMRLAPVPLAFRQDVTLAIHCAGESSRTIHAAPAAVAACYYFAGLLLGTLDGRSKERLLSSFFYPGLSLRAATLQFRQNEHWER
jgi:ADP-ribosyl-[dinitrogen reductase] hydrolase